MHVLTGYPVLVDPALDQDPLNQQGNTGIIAGFIEQDDEVNVAFDPMTAGIYEMDTLLVLKPRLVLLDDMRDHLESLGSDLIVDLVGIYLLLDSGHDGDIYEAMNLVADNPVLQTHATIRLSDFIDLGLAYDYRPPNGMSR